MKLLVVCAALAAATPLRAQDFQAQAPRVDFVASRNDWQTLMDKLARFGRPYGNASAFVIAVPAVRGDGQGGRFEDYLEKDVLISEHYTPLVDRRLVRRIIEAKPSVFWRIFRAWTSDSSAEPRIAALLRRNPDLKPVLAEPNTAITLAQAAKLLAFLEANRDLYARSLGQTVFDDQWLFRHDGPNLTACDHTLLPLVEDDPATGVEGRCNAEALVKYGQVFKFWLGYQPEPAPQAAPSPEPIERGNGWLRHTPGHEAPPIDVPSSQKI